jgi:hypothetical protein
VLAVIGFYGPGWSILAVVIVLLLACGYVFRVEPGKGEIPTRDLRETFESERS